MVLAKSFKTDSNLEQEGIKYYPDGNQPDYFYVARLGGSNHKAVSMAEHANRKKPNRGHISIDSIGVKDAQEELWKQIMSKAIIKGWGSDKHGEGIIELEEGELVNYTPNAVHEFVSNKDYEDLLTAITAIASDHESYLAQKLEEDTSLLKKSSNTSSSTGKTKST